MKVHERYLDQMLRKSNDGDSLSLNKDRKQFPLKEQSPQMKLNRRGSPTSNAKAKSPQRRKNSFSPVAIVFTMAGICMAYFGYENSDSLEKWMATVNFSFTTPTFAQTKETPKAAAADTAPAAGANTPATKSSEAGMDFDFVKDFKDRKKALDQKEEELKTWEAEIQNQKSDLDVKIEEIKSIRKEISAQLEERVKTDQAKVETLVQVYSQMKASQAAKVFENLDEDLAVDILTKMKKKNAAEILNLLKADRAQVLSEKYAGYARKPAAQSTQQSKNEGEAVNATKP